MNEQANELNEFLEKLGKAKEIKFENVHIRFEDDISNPLDPYVAGVTLDSMVMQAETSNIYPKYSSFNADDLIYKSLSCYNLSLYWNVVKSEQVKNIFLSQADLDDSSRQDALTNSIASDSRHPENLEYILPPASFKANCMINSKAHLHDFLIPVIDIDLPLDDITMENFKISFTVLQLASFLDLYNYFRHENRAKSYRNIRPSVPVEKNAKLWWKFAIAATIKNDNQQKKQLWYSYASAYKRKLLNPNDELITKEIVSLESSLDVFTVINIRRLVKAFISEAKDVTDGSSEENSKEENLEKFNQLDHLEKSMTPEETIAFIETINDDSETTGYYPKQFVGYSFTIKIQSVKLFVIDANNNRQLIAFPLKKIDSCVKYRPASSGWNFTSSIDDLSVVNSSEEILVAKEFDEQAIFVDFMTSPVNSSLDFAITIKTSSLHVIYDARTINTLFEIFTRHSHDSPDGPLDDLNKANMLALRQLSYAALEYAVSKRRKLDLNVNVAPFYLVVPSGGILTDDSSDAMVICFGRLGILSLIPSATQFSQNSTIDQIIDGAYESFEVSLSEVQLFLTTSTKWKDDIRNTQGVDPILRPTVLNVLIQKSIVSDVSDLPNFRVKADVPSIALIVGDSQLFKILTIITKLPLPKLHTQEESRTNNFFSDVSHRFNNSPGDSFFQRAIAARENYFTHFEGHFFIKEIQIEFTRQQVIALKASGPVDNAGHMISFVITYGKGNGNMRVVLNSLIFCDQRGQSLI